MKTKMIISALLLTSAVSSFASQSDANVCDKLLALEPSDHYLATYGQRREGCGYMTHVNGEAKTRSVACPDAYRAHIFYDMHLPLNKDLSSVESILLSSAIAKSGLYGDWPEGEELFALKALCLAASMFQYSTLNNLISIPSQNEIERKIGVKLD